MDNLNFRPDVDEAVCEELFTFLPGRVFDSYMSPICTGVWVNGRGDRKFFCDLDFPSNVDHELPERKA